MDLEETKSLLRDVAVVVKEFVSQETKPLLERIEVLEANAGLTKLVTPKPRVRIPVGRVKL